MDLSKITNIHIDGVDNTDYPDFSDAYISDADYNGVPMTEEQLDELNEEKDFIYKVIFEL